MLQDGLYDMGVIGDTKLVRHREKQGIGLRNRFVSLEFLYETVRLRGVGTAEDRPHVVDDADLIAVLAAPEIGVVAVVQKSEDRARNRDTWLAAVPRLLPSFPVAADLLGLLNVEGFARFVLLQGRALKIHALLGSPHRSGIGGGSPPDALAQAF